MLKISLDNPFVFKLAIIFFGLIGYVYNIKNFNEFDALFVALMVSLFFFLLLLAEYVERKNFPKEIKLNTFFCYFVLLSKLFFLILMIKSGPAGHFDERLSIFGSSFLLGINNALSVFLFPLIPALTRRRGLFWSCILVWLVSSSVTLVYAPSKSFVVSIVFSLLFYRFLKRKMYADKVRIPLFSIKSFLISFSVILGTGYLVYYSLGSMAVDILIHRASYNYDIAIYISDIYEDSIPEHGIIFYSFLPLLKQFDPSLYDLRFFSMPQWVVYEALGIERYGRFGYPNDNFAAGLLVSYGAYALIIFYLSFFVWLFYVVYNLHRRRLGLFSLYLIFQIPLFYSSLQDFSIYFLVVSILYFSFYLTDLAFKGLLIGIRSKTA